MQFILATWKFMCMLFYLDLPLEATGISNQVLWFQLDWEGPNCKILKFKDALFL